MTESRPKECLVPFHGSRLLPCPDIRTELPYGL